MVADNVYLKAMHNYAAVLYSSDINLINKEVVIGYIKMAYYKGDMKSLYTLAALLYEGIVIHHNKKEASKLFRLSADIGSTKTMYI